MRGWVSYFRHAAKSPGVRTGALGITAHATPRVHKGREMPMATAERIGTDIDSMRDAVAGSVPGTARRRSG